MPCTPRMTGCKAACLHRAKVQAYREERIRQEDEARELANGWDTEEQEYLADHPLITYKEYLIFNKNPDPVEAEQESAA
jgi:hypothetical protein